jgi:RNA polymerase sigma-70 factor, ECF subfamily
MVPTGENSEDCAALRRQTCRGEFHLCETARGSMNRIEYQGGAQSMPCLDIGALYAAHAPFVGRVIRRLTNEGVHVDDLLQETFMVAYKKQHEFEGRSSVTTWLYAIATRLCYRHLRSQRRLFFFKERLAKEDRGSAPPSPCQQIEQQETVQMVQRVLQRLPYKQREVFILYELEEKEGNEIAQMVGAPLNTVWTRLHHARLTFIKLMRHEQSRRAK